ncbi:MAG: flagellar assembly peptidoglycan hydrolase FlgJ [Gammaproteobacteria bacterium]|nr:flagellar assembly peptidoglycan hydrolase FlgJ [Gammaproteobacteria bacterium]
MSISNQADFFLNFKQFGEMKLAARERSDDAAQSVARQFEGLFVQQMLAAMRSASKIDNVQNSAQLDFYQEMYDKQLAQSIAAQDRLGVARMIMQQMPATEGLSDQDQANDNTQDLDLLMPIAKPGDFVSEVIKPVVSSTVHTTVAGNGEAYSAVVLSKVLDDDFAEVARIERDNNRWQTPGRFITNILPLAESAAQTLGVSASLLVAQAALETGWGRHMMKFDDGRSSNNLFGIKAGVGWSGGSLSKSSLESRDGILQSQVSNFRAYASPAQSIADYVDFVQNNPRYQPALKHVGDDQAYIRELHNAGYATDPHYADKVLNILNGGVLQGTLAELKQGVSYHA